VLTRAGRSVAALVPVEDVEAPDAFGDARDAAALRPSTRAAERTGRPTQPKNCRALGHRSVRPGGPDRPVTWRPALPPSAQRQLDAFDPPIGTHIRRVPGLAADPRGASDVKAMQGGG
jgi:hypothetical protein